MMSKSVLFIGGTGVISTAVTDECLKQGIAVSMINRGRRRLPEGAEVIIADKSNFELIAEKLKGKHFDAICDFLCYSEEDIKKSFLFYKNYTNQYIFISSCAVYNKLSSQELKKEDDEKVTSVWSYSADKWACEVYLNELANSESTKVTVIRPCVTYGDTRIPYGISPHYMYHWTLAERILHGKPIITWNNGLNTSNMMRVEDFATAFVPLIGNPKAYGEAYNICGDEIPSFNEVLDVMQSYLNKNIIKIDVESEFYAKELPHKAGEILGGRSINATNSNEKIKSIVSGWKQTISLQQGITKTLAAYKANNYQRGIDWTFEGECDKVIKAWCKKKGIDYKKYDIGFIDYFGNASFNDHITYWLAFHKDSALARALLFMRRMLSKLS